MTLDPGALETLNTETVCPKLLRASPNLSTTIFDLLLSDLVDWPGYLLNLVIVLHSPLDWEAVTVGDASVEMLLRLC
jgi:hypothetical protein